MGEEPASGIIRALCSRFDYSIIPAQVCAAGVLLVCYHSTQSRPDPCSRVARGPLWPPKSLNPALRSFPAAASCRKAVQYPRLRPCNGKQVGLVWFRGYARFARIIRPEGLEMAYAGASFSCAKCHNNQYTTEEIRTTGKYSRFLIYRTRSSPPCPAPSAASPRFSGATLPCWVTSWTSSPATRGSAAIGPHLARGLLRRTRDGTRRHDGALHNATGGRLQANPLIAVSGPRIKAGPHSNQCRNG